jgi:large subunit ribosomal protein L1
LAQLEAGTIDFDVLITEPRFMPKLAKHARVLGPKGLMPNPKNGTITDNPEAKRKELEGGKVTLKTEKKAPLMHVLLGKTDMETKDLVENLNALLEAVKGKAVKASVTATMSPSVKVAVV